MMATPHLFASAAIGRGLRRRPWLAISTAVGFHFVLDATPHLDSNDLFGAPGGWTVPEVSIAVADFVLGCVLLHLMTRSHPWRKVALWAAFAGIAIDLVGTIPPAGPWFATWPGTAWLHHFHHAIQPYVPPEQLLLGFGTQAAVIAISTWVLCRVGDRDG